MRAEAELLITLDNNFKMFQILSINWRGILKLKLFVKFDVFIKNILTKIMYSFSVEVNTRHSTENNCIGETASECATSSSFFSPLPSIPSLPPFSPSPIFTGRVTILYGNSTTACRDANKLHMYSYSRKRSRVENHEQQLRNTPNAKLKPNCTPVVEHFVNFLFIIVDCLTFAFLIFTSL